MFPNDAPAPGGLDDRPTRVRALPRDAFSGPAEDGPTARAAGRVAAGTSTPHPPGVPAVLPGGRLTEPVLFRLRTAPATGTRLPAPSGPGLVTVRVVDECAGRGR